MKTILVIGAGLSASSLIRYLLTNSTTYNWQIRVVDQNLDLVKKKLNNHPNGVAISFNALDATERRPEIEKADLVISMLPARFHIDVAKDCLELKTNLITPSYISPEMKALNEEVKKAGLIFMNEIGVDPGIDHMSAMRIIHHIQKEDAQLDRFVSFCGGLIAPEFDNNPWGYKFTWNPRNVIVAGQGGAACYQENNEYKYIPYNSLFKRLDKISIPNFTDFEAYANRDSLSYKSVYGLENIPTIYRGTLRKAGYCEAWSVFVDLGMTDDSYVLFDSEKLTARNFLNAFLPYNESLSLEEKFKAFIGNNEEIYSKFEWLGMFDNSKAIGLKNATPAQLLQEILVDKWALAEGDTDMLVMYHEFDFAIKGQHKRIKSYMVNIGEDNVYTSMSNTVGLPMAICAKMILNNEIELKGVQLPIQPEVYNPILDELETFGIKFIEEEV